MLQESHKKKLEEHERSKNTENELIRHLQTLTFKDDFEWLSRIGSESAEGIVFKVQLKKPPVHLKLKTTEFAIKMYYNYTNAKSRTLKKDHKYDNNVMFSIPTNPYLMHGLVLQPENFTKAEFLALPGVTGLHMVELFEKEGVLKLLMVVMDFYPLTLDKKISEKSLTHEQIFKLSFQLFTALNHLHSNNICHCDLKPDNILLTEDMDLILTDFGCSHFIGDKLRGGNELYRAPEYHSLTQPVAPSGDIYSAGIIINEMITGQNIFDKLSPNCREKSFLHIKECFPVKKSGYHPDHVRRFLARVSFGFNLDIVLVNCIQEEKYRSTCCSDLISTLEQSILNRGNSVTQFTETEDKNEVNVLVLSDRDSLRAVTIIRTDWTGDILISHLSSGKYHFFNMKTC
eukprot:TRINITY_DN2452_c0_g1_i4.p1 TRINITY_DN2452_c0_g1~~TRINITY_DN2452_c0_g1_i4.p1  ORF type:complete len:401 (-),score=16.78 TRINITY_DN2452_c0_g1_i4:453-1655(-)